MKKNGRPPALRPSSSGTPLWHPVESNIMLGIRCLFEPFVWIGALIALPILGPLYFLGKYAKKKKWFDS